MKVLLLIVIAIGIVYAHGALSYNEALVFRRDTLTIVPAAPPEVIEPASEEAAEAPAAPRQPVTLAVEIRSEQSLQREWMHSLSGLGEDNGMLILFDPPAEMPLVRQNIHVPLDVFFVNKDGIIIQIAPNLALATLARYITAKEPVRAWLFLAAGSAERHAIKPGDQVSHPLFSPKPVLLN